MVCSPHPIIAAGQIRKAQAPCAGSPNRGVTEQERKRKRKSGFILMRDRFRGAGRGKRNTACGEHTVLQRFLERLGRLMLARQVLLVVGAKTAASTRC